jgi:hypothetical protein
MEPAMEVKDVLNTINADVLKVLASRMGIAKVPTRKGEIVAALDAYLRDHLTQWLEPMAPDQRSFLAEAAHNEGLVNPFMFEAKHGTACPLPQSYLSARAAQPLDLVLFRCNGGVGIPRTLARALRPQLPAPASFRIQTTVEIPESVESTSGRYHKRVNVRKPQVFLGEQRAVAELRRVLAPAQSGKLKTTPKNGRPTEATVRLLGQSLAAPDFAIEAEDEESLKKKWYDSPGAVRAHAWGVLVQQCGWCRRSGEKLALTAAGKDLMAGFDPSAFRKGFDAFVTDDRFDEFNRIANIKGQSGNAKRAMTPPSQRKSAIAIAMRQWPVGEWIAFDHLFRCIKAFGHYFPVCHDPWLLYIADREYGSLGYDHVGDSLEKQYLRAFLMESLATLGLIDIAYTWPHGLWPELGDSWGTDDLWFLGRYDGLLYARLNPLGAYCLGLREGYEESSGQATRLLRVLPTRDIVLPDCDDPNSAEIALLERMARRTGEKTWRLDESRILDHLETGGTMQELKEFVERSAKDEIPQTVQVWFEDMTRRASAIVGQEEALLLELRDEPTALLVAHDPRAGKYCRHAGGRYLAVPRRNERAFRSAVKALGMILPM